VNYSASKEDADRIVADIKAKGGKAIAVKGDVAKADDMGRLFEETKKTFGRMDVLVNNAGIYRFAGLEEITEDEFHQHFNINVLGTILATREAVKYFGPNGGSVINMSSIASAGAPEAAVYSGSKGAVDAITRGLARNWDREKSELTPLRRAASRPRVRTAVASWAAISRKQ
jgi:Dehydrogenases with different specificities (related to short-chain alcohol dehydrogenases)